VKKAHRSRALATSWLLAISALVSGCGGFSGSHSVSPASILLPGLLKADPSPAKMPGHPGREDGRVAALDPVEASAMAAASAVRVVASRSGSPHEGSAH